MYILVYRDPALCRKIPACWWMFSNRRPNDYYLESGVNSHNLHWLSITIAHTQITRKYFVSLSLSLSLYRSHSIAATADDHVHRRCYIVMAVLWVCGVVSTTADDRRRQSERNGIFANTVVVIEDSRCRCLRPKQPPAHTTTTTTVTVASQLLTVCIPVTDNGIGKREACIKIASLKDQPFIQAICMQYVVGWGWGCYSITDGYLISERTVVMT